MSREIMEILYHHRMNAYGTTQIKQDEAGVKEMRELDSVYAERIQALITTSLIEELENLRGKADYDLPYPELSEAQNPIVSVIDQRIKELKE